MRTLSSLLLISLLAVVVSTYTYKIQKADVAMVYIVEGSYEDNEKLPKISFRSNTGGRIPIEVTLLGNGITQISVKEGPATKQTIVTNINGYSRGSPIKLFFIAHSEGYMAIAKDHFNKEAKSIITILLPSVPFYDLGTIVTNNLAGVKITERLLSQVLTEYPKH